MSKMDVSLAGLSSARQSLNSQGRACATTARNSLMASASGPSVRSAGLKALPFVSPRGSRSPPPETRHAALAVQTQRNMLSGNAESVQARMRTFCAAISTSQQLEQRREKTRASVSAHGSKYK